MKKYNTLYVTKLAIAVALVFLLGLTPLGYINIGLVRITTIHILVILISLLLGKVEGIVAGVTFGVTSIISALTTGGIFAPIFLNPLVSVLPRMILPFVAYYIFRFLLKILANNTKKKMKITLAATISAAIATTIHTILVLLGIWVFRSMSPDLTDQALLATIIGLLSVNFPLELIFACVVSGGIVPTLYPFFQKATASNV